SDNHVDDNKIDYNYQQFSANPMWLQRLNDKSFAGIGFDFNYSSGEDFDSLDSSVDYSELEESSRSVGANFLLNYDTRDYVLNPSDGRLLQMNTYFYRQFLGSKTDFEVYDLMYSEYMPIARDSDVLAWQIRSRLTHGDVPWDQLSKIGGGSLLRGYNIGRYRDKQMLLAQAEYRMNLTGRHGMVFWSGIGMVADQVSDFSTDEILPSAGVGYRFEVKPRVNLRLDLAFAKNETGFYFNVNEAF
ncbi:MAG: BamA/TamA family outer membrane protein, partial [Psychromonas sp.]